MLNAALERHLVGFAHYDVYVPLVFVDQCLPQRREISGRRAGIFSFFRWQENERLAGLQATAFSLEPYACGLSRSASQIKSIRHGDPRNS
jgi:hypothetical protein